MKKIDVKKALNERVRNTEWTEENTWNVLRKIRNAKSVRREFSLRRLMPAAVALVLVLGIGVAALTGNPGGPDPIRDKDTYTAQPLVTALSAGQGEGTGDLPEGEDEGTSGDYEAGFLPEGLQLRPVGLSVEKQGIRVEVISAAVKGDESFMKISIQDLEGKYADLDMSLTSIVNTVRPDDVMETPLPVTVYRNGYDISSADTDEEKHKSVYICKVKHSKQIQPEEREVTLGVNFIEFYRDNRVDLTDVLREHGETEEGLVARDYEGFIGSAESMRMLDTEKKLNIPLDGDDILLTGIGWINGKLHIRTENTGSRELLMDNQPYSPSCFVWYSCGYNTEDQENFREESYSPLKWKDSDTGKAVRYETLINCGPEEKDKVNLSAVVINVEEALDDDWTVQVPLSTIYVEDEPVEVETKSPVLDADIAYDISEFFRDWAAGDAELMWGDVTLEWRLSREDGDGSLRSLIASGTPRRYQINDITDGASDGGKIITCTVEMTIPGTEEIEIRRYRVSVKPTEHGFYKVDPAGFIDWEDGEYDPAMEMVLVDQTTVLNKLQSDGYSDTTKYLKPMNLICEKQGIRLNVMSGGIRDQEGWFVCAVEDMEGAYADFPIDPVFSGNFGAEAEVTSTRMYRNALEHYTVYMVYVNYKQPVTPEDCTVTLNMDSVMVHEGAQADLVPLLQEHAKTVEGVELPQLATIILRNRDRGATEVPGLKVLDYTQPLNIPLFNHTYLANAGWIDGKLHVQICHTNRTPDSYDALWINTLLDGKMDILRKETDYSPVDWYDDKAYWYEYIFDYTPEDIEQLEMTAAFLDGRKELKDDWSVSFPLSMICAEDKPAAAETAELSQAEGENMQQYYARIKDEMHPVGLSLEKQGIRVEIESALVHGDESLIQYSIQDLEGKYKDLYMDLDGYDFINTICANDEQVYGLINRFHLGVSILNLGEDKNTHKHGFLRQTKHTEPVQPEDREVTLGLKDIQFMWRTVKELNEYLKEYAKTEEGVFASYYIPTQETVKILGQENRLEIPLERDDVLLTGIGWIDGKLHVRVEYTGEKDPVKIAINDRVCQVGNNSIYSDTREPIRELDYSPVLFRDDSTGMVTGYEMVLDCSPEDVEKISLEVNIRVLEKVLEDDWTFQVPLNTIYEGNEPAETAAAETNEEWQNAIRSRVNEILTCWQQKDIDGLLAMCTEPWRSERTQLSQILGKRVPEIWQITDIEGEGWPAATVECEIRMQSESDVGFYFIKMKKEADGLWYFEPAGLGDGTSVYSTSSTIRDEDVILSVNETGSIVKAEEIPPFVSRINEFYTCWSKGDKEGMLALCPPDMRDTGYENFMIYLQSLPGTPQEWKIGHLYGKPEDDIRGASCEAVHLWPNGSRIMNYADIVVRKEADGQWYIIPASIDEIANRYADSAEGIPPVPTDEWHTILAGRLDEFLTCWQKNDKDGLLALCTTPWRSEWDRLNQLLENRTPQSWEIKWVQESGLPVVTVGCSISMQSEEEDGFFRFTAKKGTDGVWYFEPHEMWDTKVSVASPYSITDRDLILTGNEKGFQAKVEEIPPFVYSIMDFMTLWNEGNAKGMLALCQPSGRDERFANTVAAMVTDGDKPIEWKIGQLYGAPEEDARGAACELTIRRRDGQEIVYPVDITAIKEATGTWYLSCRSVEQISSDMLQAEQKAAEKEELRRNGSVSEEIFGRANLFYNCWIDSDREGMLALCMPVEDGGAFGSLMDFMLGYGTPKVLLSEEIRETGNKNTRKVCMGVEIQTPGGKTVPYSVIFTMEKAEDGLWYVGLDKIEFADIDSSMAGSSPDVIEEIREPREEPDIDSILKELRPVGSASEQPDWVILQVVAGLVKDDECWLEYSLQAAEGKQAGFDYSTKWFAYLYTGDFQKQFMLESIQDPICLEIDAGTGAATYLGRYKCYYPYEDVKLEDLYLSTGVSDLKISKTYHTDLKPILQEYGKTEEGMISRDHAVHVGVPEEIKVLDTGSPLNIPLGTKDAVLTGIGWIDGQLHIQIKDEGSKKARDENDAFHSPSFDLQIIARDMDTGKIVNVETEYSPVVWLDSDYCKDRYEVILNCGPEELDRLSLEACISSPFQNAHGDYGHIYLSATIPMSMISNHEIPVYYGDFYDDMMANSVKVSMELGKNKLSGSETIDVTIKLTNVSGGKLLGPVTLYDPDGNVVAEYSNEDFAAGETKEWTGKWTVTEEQLADGKVGFSVKYSDYKEGTQDVMAHKLTFSKPITKE